MIAKGLKGVIVAKTKLSHIDGSNRVLQYRGIPVETLAENYSFEEIAYFLWYGKLPEKAELGIFKQKMIKFRKIPHYVKEVIGVGRRRNRTNFRKRSLFGVYRL